MLRTVPEDGVQESSYIRKQRQWNYWLTYGSGVRQTGAGPVTSLGLSFLMCKMWTLIKPSPKGHENQVWKCKDLVQCLVCCHSS